MEVTNIINAINIIAEKIFKSVETEVFEGLDEFLVIDETILNTAPLKTLFTKVDGEGLMLLTMSFVIFFLLYYAIVKVLSMYNGESTENIFKYMLRIVICVICSTCSIYILEQILTINGLLTNIIASIGEDITKQEICFASLKEVVVNLDKYMSEEALSIDGIIKGVISFGAATILINFAIRYVTTIFLILVSPMAIMFAANSSTYGIFRAWVKLLCINLFIQNIVKLILMMPLSMKMSDSTIYKIVLVGSIYLLYRINTFAKEFLGNISEQVVRK